MSKFSVGDHIEFRSMTTDGPIVGRGEIMKILPAGQSYWLHVRQADGSTRMVFEATTKLMALGLEAA